MIMANAAELPEEIKILRAARLKQKAKNIQRFSQEPQQQPTTTTERRAERLEQMDRVTREQLEEYKKGLVEKTVAKMPKPEKAAGKVVKMETATKKEPANVETAAIEPVEVERLTGEVSAVLPRGFGFVGANGETFYLHDSKCKGFDIKDLRRGDVVTFEAISATREGGNREAVNVEKMEG